MMHITECITMFKKLIHYHQTINTIKSLSRGIQRDPEGSYLSLGLWSYLRGRRRGEEKKGGEERGEEEKRREEKRRDGELRRGVERKKDKADIEKLSPHIDILSDSSCAESQALCS